jgi:hypothetical protein
MLRVARFMASQSQKTKASSIRRVNAKLRIQSVNRVLSLTLTAKTPCIAFGKKRAPHRREHYTASDDPEFETKAAYILGVL